MNYLKLLILSTWWVLAMSALVAQDTLLLVNGTSYPVIVTQVNRQTGQILFLDWLKDDRLIHTISSGRIHQIRYAHGMREHFNPLVDNAPANFRTQTEAFHAPALFKLNTDKIVSVADFAWNGRELYTKTSPQANFRRVSHDQVIGLQLAGELEFTIGLTRSNESQQYGWLRLRGGEFIEVSQLIVSGKEVKYVERFTGQRGTRSMAMVQQLLWPKSRLMLMLSPYDDIHAGSETFLAEPNQRVNNQFPAFQNDYTLQYPSNPTTGTITNLDPNGNGPLEIELMSLAGSTQEINRLTYPLVQPSSHSSYLLVPPKRFSWDGWSLFPKNRKDLTIGDAISRLEAGLSTIGMYDYQYFPMQDGLLLMTRMERIYANGKRLPKPDGFFTQYQLPIGMGFQDLPTFIEFEEEGRYRMMVLAIGPKAPFEEAGYLRGGESTPFGRRVPADIAQQELGPDDRLYVLVYEWVQEGKGPAKFVGRNAYGSVAEQHFEGCGLFEILQQK